MAIFERKVLRTFGGIKGNENWRRRNEELMQLFGDLDILSFVSISVLNWIDRVNRRDSKRKEKVFNSNHQRSRLGGRPNNRWWNFAQTY